MSVVSAKREPQYDACMSVEPVTLGPMASHSFRFDPKHLGFVLARYKFVSKMLAGIERVAEIGCGDGLGSRVVGHEVRRLDLFDLDDRFEPFASAHHDFKVHDIVADPLPEWSYNAIYMLDVIEHIKPTDEPQVMRNVCRSLDRDGIFIAGCPSLESQAYASGLSRAGHVNCRSGGQLRTDMQKYFRNVFMFGMNDEMLHVGYSPMCQYLFALCVGQKSWPIS